MSAELGDLIDATPWVDTHEHIIEEHRRLGSEVYEFVDAVGDHAVVPPDWTVLIVGYAMSDLLGAGLSPAAVPELTGTERSAREKWDLLAAPFQAARHTGYLRAVDITTQRLCGARLSAETCEEIDRRLRALRVAGYYVHVLREVANVTRCQVHSLDEDPFCETSLPELLQQDISIVPLVRGSHPAVEQASGIDVGSLGDYLRVVEWCFERYGDRAAAIKCAWAYDRPLAVAPPSAMPAREFERLRRGEADLAEQRMVEDFLFQRCVELATDAGLPVKIHLGYLAGTHDPRFRHVFDHVRDVVKIVQANPRGTFVLMHAAWPQQEQLIALAKHHPNVVVDLCWAWSLAPRATRDFVERFLTCVPATKLLCFGGDQGAVECVVGHAEMARRGLQAALEGLVDEGWLDHQDALALVPLLMHENADRIFPHPPAARSASASRALLANRGATP